MMTEVRKEDTPGSGVSSGVGTKGLLDAGKILFNICILVTKLRSVKIH